MLYHNIPIAPTKRYWWVWLIRDTAIRLNNLADKLDRCPACGKNPYDSPPCQGHLDETP